MTTTILTAWVLGLQVCVVLLAIQVRKLQRRPDRPNRMDAAMNYVSLGTLVLVGLVLLLGR